MPRPKRTKVARSKPAPRPKMAKPTPEIEAAPTAPTKPFDDLYDVSDPDDRVRISAQRVEHNNGKELGESSASRGRFAGANVRDAGAQGVQDRPDVAEDSLLNLESDIIEDIDLDSSSPAIEVGRREQQTPRIENSLLNFRRRPRQPSILGRRPERARSSSVESNLADDNGLTSVGRTNASALSMGNFKRRPRQQSVIGRTAEPVASSSIPLQMEKSTPAHTRSALKTGSFKRRAREPSILGTAQKKGQQQLDSDDDEDDFSPEDESTPLNLSKARHMTSSSGASSNPRKRKLSAVQVPESSPIMPPPENNEAEETIPASGPMSDEEDEEASIGSSPAQPLPSIEARSQTPELMSETMAPPQSSSPTPSSPELPIEPVLAQSRGRRQLRNRTPAPRTQDSPISSPPSLTHSPNRPATTSRNPRAQPKRKPPPRSTLSTAALQALLPRRRRRAARDPFDITSSDDEIDTSGLAPEDDELSYLDARARSRRPIMALNRTPAPLRRANKAKQPVKVSRTNPKVKRTYGSRSHGVSDKENEVTVELGEEEGDPNDSLGPLRDAEEGNDSPENSQELEKRVGKELKAAAKKFKEVDQWEMEFEDVTASSSSPKDAR